MTEVCTVSPNATLRAPSHSMSTRRPALIPFSAYNTISSPSDLSSILPQRHGGTYIIPPPPPPPEMGGYHAEDKRSALKKAWGEDDDDTDMEAEGDWSGIMGKVPRLGNPKRWSYGVKDTIMSDENDEDDDDFETPEAYLRQNRDSGIHDDLFTWVNSAHDFSDSPSGMGTPKRDAKESPPLSPMSGRTQNDLNYQIKRLEEATNMLRSM